MTYLLRLTLFFATVLGMALVTVPDNSAAAPIKTYDAEHFWRCEMTLPACFGRREMCNECVRSCPKAAAGSPSAQSGLYFAQMCRSRGGTQFY